MTYDGFLLGVVTTKHAMSLLESNADKVKGNNEPN
jgi:hypothetical protein